MINPYTIAGAISALLVLTLCVYFIPTLRRRTFSQPPLSYGYLDAQRAAWERRRNEDIKFFGSRAWEDFYGAFKVISFYSFPDVRIVIHLDKMYVVHDALNFIAQVRHRPQKGYSLEWKSPDGAVNRKVFGEKGISKSELNNLIVGILIGHLQRK